MILDYKGTAVFYSDQGNGTPIVLLHGFLESSIMWQRLIPKLIERNRVITIDLLGHGQTDCLGYIHTMELMADMVRAVLIHLNIAKSIFIGHSMGGYVALAFAEKFPELLLGICLANSTAQADSPERKLNRNRAIKAVKHNHKAFVSMAVTNLFACDNQIILSEEISQVKKEALKTQQQGIIAALEGMKIRVDRTDIIKNITCPKLLIIGRRDTVIPCEILIKEAKDTKTNFVIFPDGHMSYVENESLFLQEIMHFIE